MKYAILEVLRDVEDDSFLRPERHVIVTREDGLSKLIDVGRDDVKANNCSFSLSGDGKYVAVGRHCPEGIPAVEVYDVETGSVVFQRWAKDTVFKGLGHSFGYFTRVRFSPGQQKENLLYVFWYDYGCLIHDTLILVEIWNIPSNQLDTSNFDFAGSNSANHGDAVLSQNGEFLGIRSDDHFLVCVSRTQKLIFRESVDSITIYLGGDGPADSELDNYAQVRNDGKMVLLTGSSSLAFIAPGESKHLCFEDTTVPFNYCPIENRFSADCSWLVSIYDDQFYMLNLETWEFERTLQLPILPGFNLGRGFKVTDDLKMAVLASDSYYGCSPSLSTAIEGNDYGLHVFIIDLLSGDVLRHERFQPNCKDKKFLAQLVLLDS